MTEKGGGAAPFLAFLVGGVIVTAAAIGFFMYTGHGGKTANTPSHLSVSVRPPHPRSG